MIFIFTNILDTVNHFNFSCLRVLCIIHNFCTYLMSDDKGHLDTLLLLLSFLFKRHAHFSVGLSAFTDL